MGRTLRELDATMGADELMLWEVFEEEFTLPDPYFLAGQICTATVRAMTGANVGPGDFVPYFKQPKPAQSPAEMKAILNDAIRSAKRMKGK